MIAMQEQQNMMMMQNQQQVMQQQIQGNPSAYPHTETTITNPNISNFHNQFTFKNTSITSMKEPTDGELESSSLENVKQESNGTIDNSENNSGANTSKNQMNGFMNQSIGMLQGQGKPPLQNN